MNTKRTVFHLFIVFILANSINLHAEFKTIQHRLRHHPMSDKRMISNCNYDFLPREDTMHKIRSLRPDTIHILAIRVDFIEDNSRFTTGNGKFDYSDDDTYFINPPPHDKNYFVQQLLALSNYFENVSRGQLILTADVYPEASLESYSLNQPMTYYSPNTTEEELDQRLGEFFRDSFMAAAEDDRIDFSKYDAFIIFHAGVGADFTFDLESTPNDLPSVFLNLNDLRSTIGNDDPSFAGIKVGDSVITEGLILPETQCQMGYDIGLLGTTCIMFGHQIGLPNLYDSDTGRPGIGAFGLMDQGSANFLGLLPAQPCAWSKVFLGWEEPIVLSTATGIEVAAGIAAHPGKIFKIPINATEYYLIENRQRHALRDVETTVGYDENGTRVEFKVREGGSYELTPSSEDGKIGVIVDVEEYDFGLPGSGILIWHIDEAVIEQKYTENRVNTDIDHRGVDLVEADGPQDLGRYYNFFGIEGYESGYGVDMWYGSNDAHKDINQTSIVEFTPESIPASRSHSKANTHVIMRNFSEPDSIMTFDLTYDLYAENFPIRINDETNAKSVLCGDMWGDGNEELIICATDGSVYAWDAQGKEIIQNSDSLTLADLKGDPYKVKLAIFATLDETVSYTPALGNLDEDDHLELVVVTDMGNIVILDAIDDDANGRADVSSSFELGETVSTNPVIVQIDNVPHIIVGHQSGTVTALDAEASPVWQFKDVKSEVTGIAFMGKYTDPHIVVTTKAGDIVLLTKTGDQFTHINTTTQDLKSPVIGDLERDGTEEIIVNDESGNFFVFYPAAPHLRRFTLPYTPNEISALVVADINNDGFLEIIAQSDGKAFAFHHNGVLMDNFPVEFTDENGVDYPEPVVVDLDDDDDYEIILGSSSGDIFALDSQGKTVSGYPLSIAHGVQSTPTLGDFNNDDVLDMAFPGADGFIYNLNLGASFREDMVLWRGFRNGPEHSGQVKIYPLVEPQQHELMPSSSVYNYPNPTEGNSTTIRYYLGEPAEVNIRLYDMAGELVKEMEAPGISNVHNEIELDLSDIQSGVYLTRVEAKSSASNKVTFFKMAVIK
ncbi:T9SS type A sorting domain-containing protein [candidate division KSB1 bacterium]|nr:T9SS type A sorting domain-containing protein [candidate division KSB1 bacterium]